MQAMQLDDAIELLKNAVKGSHVDGLKHLDLTIIDATEREKYQRALMICRAHVAQGLLEEKELKSRLGIS